MLGQLAYCIKNKSYFYTQKPVSEDLWNLFKELKKKMDAVDRIVQSSKPLAQAVFSVEMADAAKGLGIKFNFAKTIIRVINYLEFIEKYSQHVKDDVG